MEYNITDEIDGDIYRVKVSTLWHEKRLEYVVVVEYYEGTKFRISQDEFARLNPVRIR